MDKVYRVNNLLIMERVTDAINDQMLVNLDLVTTVYNFNDGHTHIVSAHDDIKVDSEWFEQIMKLWIEYVSYGR